jgi:hypothetical protein
MAISFVAATDAHSNSSGTSLSIDKPAGAAAGDVVIIAVGTTSDSFSSAEVFTAPSGFTKQSTVNTTNGFEAALCVMSKILDGSEGSSFTVSWTPSSRNYTACAAAYRGASGTFLAQGTSNEMIETPPLSTASVNNTDAASWRITVGYFADGAEVGLSGSMSTNEVSRRAPASGGTIQNDSGYYHGMQFYDSNGAIATGSSNRSFTLSGASAWTAITWIGVLEAGSATPATGVVNATLPAVTGSLGGDVNVPGTLSCTLPSVTATGAGFGQPPPVDGSMAATLPSVTATADGGVPISGTLNAPIPIAFNGVGETRVFGTRVITVEADESRRILVQSRGVDD